MARITGSYPDDLNLLIEGAVEAGVFLAVRAMRCESPFANTSKTT